LKGPGTEADCRDIEGEEEEEEVLFLISAM
jgi:hypothetical protein